MMGMMGFGKTDAQFGWCNSPQYDLMRHNEDWIVADRRQITKGGKMTRASTLRLVLAFLIGYSDRKTNGSLRAATGT